VEHDVTGGAPTDYATRDSNNRRQHGTLLCACVIILAGVVTYWSSLGHPFLFDDEDVITESPYIRTLWPLTYAMSAPPQSAVSGRPIVSLSLAINYRLGELDPRGYRLFNVLVHILAGLTLFGVVRRTLTCQRLASRFGQAATPLAFVAALLWLLHPLQTESVTYVIQRTESMMGLFYLLTLYCAIRSWNSLRRLGWQIAAVIACALGMGTKEVMVTAPLMVLLYDAFFGCGSIRQALRRRPGLYGGLAATWVVLAALLATGPRSETVGFSHGVTAIQYAANQCLAVVAYLRLAVWPHPLILDYGFPQHVSPGEAAPYAAVLVCVLAATVAALAYRPPLGFAGLWFLVILGPTSSFVPIATEVAAERRMYLSLAAVCVLVVVAAYWAWNRVCITLALRPAARTVVAAAPAITAMLVLAILSAHRNDDYRSPFAMWSDTVNKRPDNARARNNLAKHLYTHGKLDEAIGHLQEALRLKPDYYMACNNLAVALADRGDLAGALLQSEKAVTLRPNWADVYENQAYVLVRCGRLAEAAACYQQALKLEPFHAEAHYGLASTLLKLGRIEAAMDEYRLAIESQPHFAEAHNDLGALLAGHGDYDQAISHYQAAIRLRPDWAEAHHNMGLALAAVGRLDEALTSYHRAVQLNPHFAQAYFNLANALLMSGRADLAVDPYTRALSEKPDYLEAQCNLGTALKKLGRDDEAAAHFEEAMRIAFRRGEELRSQGKTEDAAEVHQKAVRIDPNSDEAHYRLGRDLLDLGRVPEAIEAFQRAIQINPDNVAAKRDLGAAQGGKSDLENHSDE
jgi:protein O-mannosyl-transferase